MNLKRLIPLYLGAVVGPMGGIGIVTILPVLAGTWAIEFGTASLAITFYMIPFVLVQLFSGAIAHLFDARKTLLFGFLVYALGATLCGLSPSLWALLCSRAVQGVGAAFLTPIIMALIGEIVPPQHVGKAIGMLGVAYTVGVTLGPLISGVIEVRYGWPWFFFFLSAISLIAGTLYAASSKAIRMEPGRGSNLPGILSLLKDTLYQPGVLFLSFSAFSFFVAYIGIMTFTAGFLKTEMELPSDQIGALISVTGITGVMISPVAGYLGDRMGRIRVFLAGSTAALLCILCMVAVPFSYWPYLALFLLFGTGTATAWTSLNTLAVEIVPAFRKPVTSVYNAIKFGGYAFSPVILSPLYGPNRLRAVQWGCMGAILISGVLALRSAAASRGTLTPET